MVAGKRKHQILKPATHFSARIVYKIPEGYDERQETGRTSERCADTIGPGWAAELGSSSRYVQETPSTLITLVSSTLAVGTSIRCTPPHGRCRTEEAWWKLKKAFETAITSAVLAGSLFLHARPSTSCKTHYLCDISSASGKAS